MRFLMKVKKNICNINTFPHFLIKRSKLMDIISIKITFCLINNQRLYCDLILNIIFEKQKITFSSQYI